MRPDEDGGYGNEVDRVASVVAMWRVHGFGGGCDDDDDGGNMAMRASTATTSWHRWRWRLHHNDGNVKGDDASDNDIITMAPARKRQQRGTCGNTASIIVAALMVIVVAALRG